MSNENPKCEYCLGHHTAEEYCRCFLCKVEMHPQFIRCAVIDGNRVSLCPTCDDNRHVTTSPGRIELKLMGCLVVLMTLMGCALPAPSPLAKTLAAIQPPSPRVASVRSLVAIQIPGHTNNITLAWTASTSPDAIGYRIYYHPSTNGSFVFLAGVPSSTNCAIPTTLQLIGTSTNALRIRTFRWDGKSYTNVSQFMFTLTATNAAGSESIQCAPALWPLPPPPPPNFIELNWGRVTNVTVLASSNLTAWATITNIVGSNAVIPMSKVNQFFRLWSPAPALTVVPRTFYQPL